MATLTERIDFLRRRGIGYAWLLLLRKLGKKYATHRFNGRRFVVPMEDMALELIRNDEPWMIPLLKKLLPKAPGLFVDVGVNIGQTLARVKAIEPDRHVVGFEPNPECCRVLKRLMELNDYGQVTLIEAALADHAGKTHLHVDEPADVRGSIITGFRDNMKPGKRTVEVPVLDGRELAARELRERIGFIKIDVEGAELEVLRGLRPVIERDRPLILFELLGTGSADPEIENLRERRQVELLAIFPGMHYSLRRVREDTSLENVGEFEKYPLQSMCNYLGIPDERVNGIAG